VCAAVLLCGCVRKISVAPVKPFQDPVALPARELPALPILAYHRVTPRATNHMVVAPELLREHLRALRDSGYTAITPDEWYDALHGRHTLPPKPVMITFDDAWRDQYEYALPILDEHGVRAAFFAYTSTIGSPGTMSWDELRDVARRGHIVGCHTATHSDLARPFGHESADQYGRRLQREIVEARHNLEQQLGVSVQHFCYPYGYYNSNVIALVRAAGYRTAMTVNPAVNDARTPLPQLGRIIVAPWHSGGELLGLMAARPLRLQDVAPGDGAMPHGQTTQLRAQLPGTLAPLANVRVKWNWRWAEAHWDAASRTVTLPFSAPLAAGIYTAQVHAWDAQSNHYVSAWLFQQTAAPLQAAGASHALAHLHEREL